MDLVAPLIRQDLFMAQMFEKAALFDDQSIDLALSCIQEDGLCLPVSISHCGDEHSIDLLNQLSQLSCSDAIALLR